MIDPAHLQTFTKDQLIVELIRAREECNELRSQLAARASAGVSPVVAKGPKYTVSLNVLNITGTTRQRVCRSVPLQAVLNRSYNRPDEREADTPVASPGERHPRFSVEMGRFSGFSVGSDDGGGLLLPGGRSPPPSEGRGSGQLSPQVGPAGSVKRGRPAPLLHVAGPLDSDAIVSRQTLHAFANMYQGAPLSPQSSQASSVMHYIMDVFVRAGDFSHEHLEASGTEAFGRTFLRLCGEVEKVLKDEPFHANVASPAYVFGDIHGNFRDLHYFATQLINFDDLRFVPYRLVFLGDYVDRGEFSVETVAFLFALKVLAPDKVTLLRGNHEDTLVNGDLNLYRDTSFRAQCRALFGTILGEEVWAKCNRAFSFMPLTANIDKKIFCTHGGLPRYNGGDDHRMEMLMRDDFPKMETFFSIPEREPALHTQCRQIASDVCWSDPADDDNATNQFGFGPNPRGNGVILFGTAAVDDFLDHYGFEYIFRAHQEKSDGLKISKNARVLTIFSTSAYVGHQNGAGVVYVGDGRIRLIVKEPDEEET